MSDLRELYQDVIVDHYKSPRNFREIDEPVVAIEGYNPLCGDKVKVFVRVADDGTIEDIAFQGVGCAISTASASMMTERLLGANVVEAERVRGLFQGVLTGDSETELMGSLDSDLGQLEALSGVKEYPMRVKCATLPWHALKEALSGGDDTVSTEA